jgi:carbonic anhydrase
MNCKPTVEIQTKSQNLTVYLYFFSEGSEHLIENVQFPMESHFVFMNEKYADPHDALKNKDGLAVIGRFYEVETSRF